MNLHPFEKEYNEVSGMGRGEGPAVGSNTKPSLRVSVSTISN